MRDWDRHYREEANHATEPDPLLVRAAALLPPGRSLDLACGTGRHALWLARQGWQVTAVDRSAVAIEVVRRRGPGLAIDAQVDDLEAGAYRIAPGAWDLVCDFFFLHRPLFAGIRAGVRAGGLFVAAIHLEDPQAPAMNPDFLLRDGELRALFADWEIVNYSEGRQPGKRRRAAEIIARKN